MVGATQPPRRIAAFMGFVLIALVFPFFYDYWDSSRAEGITAGFVIWCALAVGASVAMMDIRRQRVALEAAGTRLGLRRASTASPDCPTDVPTTSCWSPRSPEPGASTCRCRSR
jgi:hypothetical protein